MGILINESVSFRTCNAGKEYYIKKKNLLLLTIICAVSLVFFSGLLVYAFELQDRKEPKVNNAPYTSDNITAEEDNSDNTNIDESGSNNINSNNNSAENDSSDSSASSDVPIGGDSSDVAGNVNSDGTSNVSVTPGVNSEDIGSAAADSSDNQTNTSGQTDINSTGNTGNQEESGSVVTRSEPIVLGFVGDINFDEESNPMARYDKEKEGILGGVSSDLVKEMNGVDIMMLNNEFAYSSRGTKTPDKSYTFRANPSRVDILGEMGVDIVSLANNHALDYGPDALLDTFKTLEDAGIDYVGAGKNLDRAIKPIYYTFGNTKIAYLAASRVVYSMDWYASDTKLGMIGTYDPTLILTSIKEAAANSDYVVIFLHWGVERNNSPEDYQRTLAKQYIDAGADAVIGCHPHVLQGFEYYKGKPIAYSLGNFWFNSYTRDAGLLKLYLDQDGTVRVQILPTVSENTFTSMIKKKAERKTYFDFMQEISFGVTIDNDGFVTEKKQ